MAMTMHHGAVKSLAALTLAVLLAACGEKEAPAPKAAPPAATAPAAPAPASAPAPAKKADASDKLQTYIACYNRLDGSAHRSISRYASWIKDMNVGPTGKEKVVYGLYSIESEPVAKCKAEFTQAAAEAPALEKLDAAARAYIETLEGLSKVATEAYSYYDRENYKDDAFAKGKTLHPALTKEMAAFAAASEKFSAELEVENDKLLAAELEQIEKTEGRKLAYWRMSLMNHAKQLINAIEGETFPVEAATAKLAAYEKVADETKAYGAANKAELPPAWFTVDNAAENFRKAAKERVRRIRDKVPYNEGEKMMLQPGSAWMVEGSQEKVVKAYNDLVSASNALH